MTFNQGKFKQTSSPQSRFPICVRKKINEPASIGKTWKLLCHLDRRIYGGNRVLNSQKPHDYIAKGNRVRLKEGRLELCLTHAIRTKFSRKRFCSCILIQSLKQKLTFYLHPWILRWRVLECLSRALAHTPG